MDEEELEIVTVWDDTPSPTALEEARKFVHFKVADTLDADEVRGNIIDFMDLEVVLRGLEAVERIAHEPPEGASLAEVVKWDAGWMLPNDTEEEARLWLLEFAEFVREVLGEHAPPRKHPAEVPRPRRYFFPE